MSNMRTPNNSRMVTAATAISALGLLTFSAAAVADPMTPLAPECADFDLANPFKLTQSDGWTVEIPAVGDRLQGRATAIRGDLGDRIQGNVVDNSKGNNIDFKVYWDNGHKSHYYGVLTTDDLARGERDDIREQGAVEDNTTWNATEKLRCVVYKPENVPNQPPPQKAPPAQVPPPEAQPKQGPTVSAEPGLTGVTFHITDRSGVASQCTYSSEGFESSFGLPANGSHDLFVPAVRFFKTRTGTVTCDNGTSTNTSVFY